MITAQECSELIDKAIKSFGEHSYYDKGPTEVMDFKYITDKLMNMSGQQIADMLVELIYLNDYGVSFTKAVMSAMDDCTDIDALYIDDRLVGLY